MENGFIETTAGARYLVWFQSPDSFADKAEETSTFNCFLHSYCY